MLNAAKQNPALSERLCRRKVINIMRVGLGHLQDWDNWPTSPLEPLEVGTQRPGEREHLSPEDEFRKAWAKSSQTYLKFQDWPI
jgi:hypothetical protein